MCQFAETVTAPDATIGSKLPFSVYEMPASMMPSGSISLAAALSSGVLVVPAPQPARATDAATVPATAIANRPTRRRVMCRFMCAPGWWGEHLEDI